MADQAFTIHGHFYQPPREDPITGEIPLEPGASPYHNWNERIHDHCYKPNAELGNFERISFNVGPTLMEWMQEYDPATVEKIVEQERRNVERYGVGNAMAQPYNHTILPLSSKPDKISQVRWGIADFKHRFGHHPTGMWLPEAAVDLETLEVLADHGIQFIILAPWQAQETDFDISQPYRIELPGGKEIIAFFYEQELSMRVSFDPGSTTNGDHFIMETICSHFRPQRRKTDADQLLVIASDGELYGHHQPFRDKFLAYLMDGALKDKPVQATYPALWLKEHKVTSTVHLRERTSWSCHHGVLRWSGDCGCAPHSEWKAPLRKALDQIAAAIDALYLSAVTPYMKDPWSLRHGYGAVLTGEMDVIDLIQAEIQADLKPEELDRIQVLLKAQYERQRMFTSCGWFFDDFDRIEPRNNIAYAAQAVWLTYHGTGVDISTQASDWLRPVKSWRSGLRADVVFDHHLQRARNNEPALQMVW